MNILAISHSYPRRNAPGTGSFIHRWHLALRALGHQVDVMQLTEWTPPALLARLYAPWRYSHAQRRSMFGDLDGVTIHHPRNFTPRPSRFFPGDSWARESATLARYARGHARLRETDVVLAHFMVPDGFHALSVGQALGRPVAAVAWGDDVHAWPSQWPSWRHRLVEVLRSIDLPIACSERMVSDANAWLDAPRDDWGVVYGGVDLDVHVPVADKSPLRERAFVGYRKLREPGRKVLLTIARPVLAKGYVELLDAWKRVSHAAPDWALVAVGGHDGDIDVAELIASRDLGDRAYWMGYRAGRELSELIMASDAFVLASHNEGLSLSLLEAMASGLPAIATDVGGHRELIRSSEEGWLVPSRDCSALASALTELLSSTEKRERVGRQARIAAERIGSPSTNASILADHLQILFDTRSTRSSRPESLAARMRQ